MWPGAGRPRTMWHGKAVGGVSDRTVGPGGTGAAAGVVGAAVGRGGPVPDGRAGAVPDGAVVRGVWAVCAGGRPVTAREVADMLGIRRESVNRALRQLERVGRARRERGDARTSTPDLWSPASERRDADLSEHAPEARTAHHASPASADTSSGFPVSAQQARMRAASSTPPVGPGTYREFAPRRLAAGELQEQVHELLLSRLGEALTPLQLARALGGRSQGAVANACKRLVAQGEAVCTCQAPMRFAATSGPE